jgi:hypothetical protein
MDAIEVLRALHRGVRFLFENSVRGVLTHEQMKERPDGRGNSVAWLMWHTARTEDMAINSIIQGTPQILIEGNWAEKLGIDATHIGTGLGEEEVAEFTKELNVEAVDQYWQETANASYRWLKSISSSDLDVVPDFQERLAAVPPVIVGGSSELAIQFWKARNAGQLFQGLVIGHGFIHVGQMQEIGGRIGVVGWF